MDKHVTIDWRFMLALGGTVCGLFCINKMSAEEITSVLVTMTDTVEKIFASHKDIA